MGIVRTTALFWGRLLEASRQWNGVEAAGLTSFLPLTGTDSQTSYRAEGEAMPVRQSDRKWVDIFTVSAGYFTAMEFRSDRAETSKQPTMARIREWRSWTNRSCGSNGRSRNPVGKRIEVSGKLWTIVGVAGHVKPYGLDTGEHARFTCHIVRRRIRT